MPIRGLQAHIISFALRFRGIVVALCGLIIVYGIYALDHAAYDVFPEFAPPQVSIQTEAPGLAPEQVETLVTRPIETTIEGLPGEQRMLSNSIQGLSVITIFFDPSANIYLDRQLVSERLAEVAGQLPTGVAPPVMTPLTSSSEIALVAGLTSSTKSLMQLRTIARWTIRPALMAVPGVADVELFGGQTQATQIFIHPRKLIQFGLSFSDVLAAAKQATGVRGAGFISTPNQRIILQTKGQALVPKMLAQTVLTRHNGASVTLGDVTDVVDAPEPAIGAATINGQPGVVMNIAEQYGANTLQVTKGIDKAFAELRPALDHAGVTLHDKLFRPANFITAALDNLRSALIIGVILVMVVLFLFLLDLRAAAICCAAIPISLLSAIVVLQWAGVSINTMVLGGLAVALGEVVDDAVIAVENITRRLRENRSLAKPRSAARVVLEATIEVRSAVVYATFAVVLVFLPVLALSGIGGRLFGPLGFAYIAAVLASLVVAITLTPALSLALLSHHMRDRDPPIIDWSRRHYEVLLRAIARMPRVAIVCAVFLTLAGVALVPFFNVTFLPELHEGHFVVHMTAIPGTSLAESLRMGARVTAALEKLPIVRAVAQRAGRAELTADTHGTHQSELEVDLKPLTPQQEKTAKSQILKALSDFPGVNIEVNTFLAERIDETLSGYTAPVVVNVYGNDLKAINKTAQAVVSVLRQIPGASSVEMQSPPGLPQLTLRLRRTDLERWGLDPVQVLNAIQAAYQGDVVGQTYVGDRVFDVVVKLAPKVQSDIAAIGNLPLRAKDGHYVPLRKVVDIDPTSGLYRVQHQGGRRLEAVTADVEGRALLSFVNEAKAQVAAKVRPPSGVYIEFSGAAEGEAQAQRDLIFKALLTGVGMMILLSVVTRSWRNLLVILANLPFALVGGFVAAFAMGGVLSLGSLVGFVTLFGITLRNSVMLIAHYGHLVEIEGMKWDIETAIRGAADRLAPILMTSLVTGLGLLPLAAGMNAPGREIEGPMALVILGGLFTSTILNLLILPTLVHRYGRFEAVKDVDGLLELSQ